MLMLIMISLYSGLFICVLLYLKKSHKLKKHAITAIMTNNYGKNNNYGKSNVKQRAKRK